MTRSFPASMVRAPMRQRSSWTHLASVRIQCSSNLSRRPRYPRTPSLAVNYRTTLADVSTSPENSDDVFTESEMEALRATPPEIVIANHVFHLLELAAIHVSATPPQLSEAQITIDAVAGVMGAVGDRLGEPSALLTEALAQIQLAYVRVAADADGE